MHIKNYKSVINNKCESNNSSLREHIIQVLINNKIIKKIITNFVKTLFYIKQINKKAYKQSKISKIVKLKVQSFRFLRILIQ